MKDKGFMKRICLMLMFLLSVTLGIYAQEEDPVKKEKMFKDVLEFKMKYLAQEMDLSEVQKKKFFELYEEMIQSKKECYHSAMKMDRKLKHDKNASEEEYQHVTLAFDKANAEWSEIEKSYNEKFSEFLTQKQIYKMREAEKSYREKVGEMKQNRKREHKKKHEERK